MGVTGLFEDAVEVGEGGSSVRLSSSKTSSLWSIKIKEETDLKKNTWIEHAQKMKLY